MDENVDINSTVLTAQAMVDRLMPGQAQRRRHEELARIAIASDDFLIPEWSMLSSITVLTLCEAVALARGIHKRHAWVIEHQVGESAVRGAIEAARALLDYFVHKRGIAPATKIPLDSFVQWMGDAGQALPRGFPGSTDVTVLKTGNPPVVGDPMPEAKEERQARRFRQCIDAGLKMPTSDYGHLPRGIVTLAKAEGISRQAFSEDVKAHISRLGQAG